MVQTSFIARMYSRVTAQRSLNATPWFSSSSAFQPAPIPKMKRPFESASSEAIRLASASGWCSGTRQMPVPTRSCVVTAAACASATNGSYACQ